jgi:hypothetical protein
MTERPTRSPILLTTALLALALTFAVPAGAPAASGPPGVGGQDLDNLLVTLEREYHLWTVYDRAIGDFGVGEPFVTAREEKGQRLRELIRLYRSFGLAVPGNPWQRRMVPFRDRSQACLAGFRGELELASLYAGLTAETGQAEIAAAYRAAAGGRGAWLEGLRDCALEGRV